MVARLSLLLALCLGVPGCVDHMMLVTPRFVDAPADADCRTLWRAVEARGWEAELEDRTEALTVITADETWVISGRVERVTARTWLPLGTVQPRAWSAALICPPDYTRQELPVRTCRAAGRSFGVVDPRQAAAIRRALSEPQPRCTLEVEAELRGRDATASDPVTLRRSLRPFLEAPR